MLMFKRLTFLLLLCCGLALANTDDGYTYGEPDLKGIFNPNADIKIDNKPIFLVFGQTGCYYCAMLRSDINKDDFLKNYLKANFSPYYINIRHDKKHNVSYLKLNNISSRDYARLYNLTGTPMIVFVSEEGKTIFRVSGYPGHDRLVTMLKFIKSNKWKSASSEQERIVLYQSFEKSLKEKK
ncbi:thioredoxin fold domain-containing protein [Helicobacter sp. 11S02629-2]|uniref:thioredoxin family protein n=1 Tax=Helicobacter sp. 11S02629-2 TaxID=1476195 RepID=UPI000BA5944F|nr:thioredoxin fold domain-containing protein [Helicobacter sp. 11S02629-2]PAF43277.1 hypothetical protein BKH40_07180 [Helicobacter sp. 11S02629-2]